MLGEWQLRIPSLLLPTARLPACANSQHPHSSDGSTGTDPNARLELTSFYPLWQTYGLVYALHSSYLHFTDGKAEAQRGEETCPISRSQGQRWYLNPGSLTPEPKPLKSDLGQNHKVMLPGLLVRAPGHKVVVSFHFRPSTVTSSGVLSARPCFGIHCENVRMTYPM